MITGIEKMYFSFEDKESSCIEFNFAKNKKPSNFLKGFYEISFLVVISQYLQPLFP